MNYRVTVVLALVDRDGGHCADCGELLDCARCARVECVCDGASCPWASAIDDALPATIDHFIPQALGGGHELANLRLVCPRCNSSKGARHPYACYDEVAS